VFNSILYSTILYCSPIEQTLPGVVITAAFLYTDDILHAPEKQFASGKLQMKHLLAKIHVGKEVGTAPMLAAHFAWQFL
jgi:hypothetical protein